MGEIYYGLGEAALLENDVEHAARRARQALANAASSRQRIELGLGQRLLARVAALQPDLVPEGSPSALFTQSEVTLRETGDREELAQSLLAHAQHLGQTQGDAKHMRALQREAHALFTDLGMQWRIPGPT